VIELQFLSTSFKQAQGIQPFPPELVLAVYCDAGMLAPIELQFPVVEWKGLTAAYELKTHAFKMKAGQKLAVADGCGMNFRFPKLRSQLS